jgi:hypothetical protein
MRGSTGAKIFVLALCSALVPAFALAGGVRLSWNPNQEPDLEGYRVFCGYSSRSYSMTMTVGRVTSMDISGLSPGVTCYFAVRAFDFSGNESPYSDEVSVTMPVSTQEQPGSGGTGTGTGSGVLDGLTDALDGIVKSVRSFFGLDPANPMYSLGDFSRVTPPREWAGEAAAPAGASPSADGANPSILVQGYAIRDVILEEGQAFDLSVVYPEGSYLLYPLSDDCPAIDDEILTTEAPGLFYYLVFDCGHALEHVLRVSVACEIYDICSYDPTAPATLDDCVTGVLVSLGSSATEAVTPIAVCRGPADGLPGSAQAVAAPGGPSATVDILPYGLRLASAALVSLPWTGAEAKVELYDFDKGGWTSLDDVQVENGLVTFSTEELGRFRVSDPGQAQGGDDGGGGGGGGSCFVRASLM